MALEPAILHALASPRRQEILRLVWRDEQTAGAIHKAMPAAGLFAGHEWRRMDRTRCSDW